MSIAPHQAEYIALYNRAFAEYRAHALWFMRSFDQPTPDDALAVARALRIEGDLPARRLAEQIEQALRPMSGFSEQPVLLDIEPKEANDFRQ